MPNCDECRHGIRVMTLVQCPAGMLPIQCCSPVPPWAHGCRQVIPSDADSCALYEPKH